MLASEVTVSNVLGRQIEYVNFRDLTLNPENLRDISSYDLEEMTDNLCALDDNEDPDLRIAQVLSPIVVTDAGLVIEGNRRISALINREDEGLPVNPEVPVFRLAEGEEDNEELLLQLQIIFGSSNKRLSPLERGKGIWKLYQCYLDNGLDEKEAANKILSQPHLSMSQALLSQNLKIFSLSPDWLLEACQEGKIAFYAVYTLLTKLEVLQTEAEGTDFKIDLRSFYSRCLANQPGDTVSQPGVEKVYQALYGQLQQAAAIAEIREVSPEVAEALQSGVIESVEVAEALIEEAEEREIAPEKVLQTAVESVAEACGYDPDESPATERPTITKSDVSRAAKKADADDDSDEDDEVIKDDDYYLEQTQMLVKAINGILSKIPVKAGVEFSNFVLARKDTGFSLQDNSSSDLRIAFHKATDNYHKAIMKSLEKELKLQHKRKQAAAKQAAEDSENDSDEDEFEDEE